MTAAAAPASLHVGIAWTSYSRHGFTTDEADRRCSHSALGRIARLILASAHARRTEIDDTAFVMAATTQAAELMDGAGLRAEAVPEDASSATELRPSDADVSTASRAQTSAIRTSHTSSTAAFVSTCSAAARACSRSSYAERIAGETRRLDGITLGTERAMSGSMPNTASL